MRILHITQRYWPVRGGAEIYMGEISAYLAEQGHSVMVATTDALDFERFWDPHRRYITVSEDVQDGVRIMRFPVRYLPLPGIAYPGIRRLLWLMSMVRWMPVGWMARLSRFTPWVPDLWRWLRTTGETFDLVAGMNICFEPLLEAGLRFTQRRGVPFVIYPLTHLGAGPKPGEDALGRFYTMRHQMDLVFRSQAVVAQTQSERIFYVERGLPDERSIIVGPGVNPDDVLGGDARRFRKHHSISEDTPLVLAISTMAYDKGTVHVVEAIRRLWQQGHHIDLVLIGAVLSPFKRYLKRLPPNDREQICLLGSVSEEEKRDALAAADIFVLPSRTDSFGIVYLEAWLYKKPVIGARTWGVTDVITDGKDGFLVPFGDITALAEKIALLVKHPKMRASMGVYGEQKVYTQHLWSHKHPRIQQLYHQLVDMKDL